ncbi:MAG: ribonuclease HII [bacterium]
MKVRIGLDEAGRGCVLGPLVIGLVVFESKSDDSYFSQLGVRDSKKLTANKRNDFYEAINRHCYCDSLFVTPQKIDKYNMNSLELNGMAYLVNNTIKKYSEASIEKVDYEIYIDCPIKNTDKHKHEMRLILDHSSSIKIVTENKADDKYVVVGASSIIAKVLRDKEIEKIKEKYKFFFKDIGSGYPSDWRTKEFLKKYYKIKNGFPVETRLKWGTVKNIRRECFENSKSSRKGL